MSGYRRYQVILHDDGVTWSELQVPVLPVLAGWILLVLGELTEWRWCFSVAFVVFATALLVGAWRLGRKVGRR